MTSLNPHHSFTPQRSPSLPSSQASQSPPASEGEAERINSTGGVQTGNFAAAAAAADNDDESKVTRATDVAEVRSNTSASAATTTHDALNCWTAHQSHGQVTILFYVPRWTKKEDLQVIFGSDYVIAGVQTAKEMVVQAQLAGRINTSTSTWQLEKQSNKRSRSRSRTRIKGRRITPDSHHSSEGSSSSSASGRRGQKNVSSTSSRVVPRPLPPPPPPPPSETKEFTGSPASSDEMSSFDLLARSTDTLEYSGGSDTNWNHIRENTGSSSPSLHVSPVGGGNGSSPQRLDQSITLSEESGYLPSGSNSGGEGGGGVRSLESSISLDPNHDNSSASRTRSDDDIITDAKLVTLHLDKIDGGIWPFLVSGPAPLPLLQPESTERVPFFVHSRHQSLNAALNEALNQEAGMSLAESIVSAVGEEEAENEDDSFTQSTTTIDTISSDESTTVLGGGGQEENLYAMDPTSLALMGMRHSKQGHQSPFGSISTVEESKAFEYFKRAWRRAEIPLATKRLVEDYLPLRVSQQERPLRSRLMASLGGPSALARLYVSYARLQLPSSQERQSPLAFPLGGLTNPFGRGQTNESFSSPGLQDALTFLREARMLDKNVFILNSEWNEAQSLSAQSPSSEEAWRWNSTEGGLRGATAAAASESEKASKGKQRDQKKKKRRKKTTNRDDLSRSNEKFSSDQGLVFILVSRAALLSVMVAGGVAVAGWWRRAAAAGGNS